MRRYLEFFAVTIDNPNTRAAYFHACRRFFAWCDPREDIDELADIEPMHVAAYIRGLGKEFEKPTVKQHLAAIRMLFDWLVTGQVVATNPAHSVRGPKHVVKTGKTTVLTGEQARELLDSIDVSTLVGLRDRALIAVMTFAFARIGAVVAMRVEDYFPKGKRWWVRLHEKGGKRPRNAGASQSRSLSRRLYRGGENPRRRQGSPVPLRRRPHRRADGKADEPRRRLAHGPAPRRRSRHARPDRLPHLSAPRGSPAYLEAGGTLENAQAMAAHESPRTTKLYDRTGDEITLDEVERIAI